MNDTRVLKLQITKLIDNLPAEGLQLLADFISFLESKFSSFYTGDDASTQLEEEQWSESALALQQKLFTAMENQPFPGDEPFLGDITLDEYLSLNDEEQALIWDNETTLDIMDLEEKDMPTHALPLRLCYC